MILLNAPSQRSTRASPHARCGSRQKSWFVDPGGFIVTAIIGIVGALIGGFIAGAIFDADPLDEFFDISTWLTAIVGSIILLLIYRMVVGRRSTSPGLR